MSPDLERLVGRAVLDKEFRKKLLDDPDAAVQEAGFSLTPDEMGKVRDAAKQRGKDRQSIDKAIDAARGAQWG